MVAENVVKERIKSFGFRVWSADGDVKAGAKVQPSDFQIEGEVKVKVLSAKLPASGLTITKTALTSWTIKAIDKASGEEVYLNTVNPTGKSWASEDLALAEIGKLVGDEFSKNFFLEHFNFSAQKVNLNIAGLPDAQSAKLLLRELRGFRQVLDAQLAADAGKYQLQLADGNASDLINGGCAQATQHQTRAGLFCAGRVQRCGRQGEFFRCLRRSGGARQARHAAPGRAAKRSRRTWKIGAQGGKSQHLNRCGPWQRRGSAGGTCPLIVHREADDLGTGHIHGVPKGDTTVAAQHDFFAPQHHLGSFANATKVPLVLWSTRKNLSRRHSMRACWREALRSAITMSHWASRPSTTDGMGTGPAPRRCPRA